MAIKRIQKDLIDFYNDPPTGISVLPTFESDMFRWDAIIMGPPNTPYEGGSYYLRIHFPYDYPIKPPKVSFITKIYHPNFDGINGSISIDILKDQWGPSLSIKKILLYLQSLLIEPEKDHLLNSDWSKPSKIDIYKLYKKAHEWAVRYADAPKNTSFMDKIDKIIAIINSIKNINIKEYVIEIDNDLKFEKEKNKKLEEEINILKKDIKKKIEEREILLNKKEKQIKILENQLYLQTYLKSNNLNANELIHKLEIKENESKDLKSVIPSNNSKEDKLMIIIFASVDETILHPYVCKNTDKFTRFENLLKEEYPEYMEDNNYYFICKGNNIKIDGTIEENNIKNNDLIIINKKFK